MSSFLLFCGAKLHVFNLSTKKSYAFFIYCPFSSPFILRKRPRSLYKFALLGCFPISFVMACIASVIISCSIVCLSVSAFHVQSYSFFLAI